MGSGVSAVRTWGRREWISVVAALALVLGVVVAWRMSRSSPTSQPRERQYRASTACLLTDDKGLAGEQAKAAWTGMQEASAATLIKVQYLSISGPQTAANGLSYFNSLGVQKCAVVVAVGKAPVAAMVDGHPRFPEIRCVAVGGGATGTRVVTVDASSPATIRDGVKAIVAAA